MRNFKTLLLKLTCMAVCILAVNNAFAQQDLPPNAIPGKCYAKCLIPDQYETVTEQILLKEASTRIEVVPAVPIHLAKTNYVQYQIASLLMASLIFA